MLVLPPEAYSTLGVTHDHPLLQVTFDPTARHFGLHFAGAYLLNDAQWPAHEYVNVHVAVDAWRDASFTAQVALPSEAGVDPGTLSMRPFDPREHQLREVVDFDLFPDVRLTGWLAEQRGEAFRWFQVSFSEAQITVTYEQVAALSG